MTRAALPGLLLCLAGCAERHPLGEVPVDGGTSTQRDLVADELARFTAWAGSGRVELSSIRFTDAPGDAHHSDGWYHRPTARIEVDVDLGPRPLQSVLRHELCHALDVQQELTVGGPDVLDDVVDAVLADDDHFLHDKVTALAQEQRRGEIFAELCEEAPLGTALLAHPCPGDGTGDLAEAAAWVSEAAWRGDPDVLVEPTPGYDGTTASWTAPAPFGDLLLVGAADLDQVTIAPYPEGDDTSRDQALQPVAVQLGDGAEVPWPDALTVEAVIAGHDQPPPHGAPTLPGFSLSSSREALAVTHDSHTLRIVEEVDGGSLAGPLAPHVLVHDGQRWSVLEGPCPTEDASVFLARDQLYLGFADGDDVRWGPVTLPD